MKKQEKIRADKRLKRLQAEAREREHAGMMRAREAEILRATGIQVTVTHSVEIRWDEADFRTVMAEGNPE